MKYLVYWKGFTTENNTWEKEKDSENTKKSSSRIWGENEYRSEITREAKYGGRKRF